MHCMASLGTFIHYHSQLISGANVITAWGYLLNQCLCGYRLPEPTDWTWVFHEVHQALYVLCYIVTAVLLISWPYIVNNK